MLLFVVLPILLSQAQAINYTDCGSTTGKILSVAVSGCEDSNICELKRGETYNFDLKFQSLTESNRLRAVVQVFVSGIMMPIPLQNPNICDHGDIECPLKNGEDYNISYDIEVLNSYPVVRADVKLELRDDKNKNVACMLLPVKTV